LWFLLVGVAILGETTAILVTNENAGIAGKCTNCGAKCQVKGQTGYCGPTLVCRVGKIKPRCPAPPPAAHCVCGTTCKTSSGQAGYCGLRGTCNAGKVRPNCGAPAVTATHFAAGTALSCVKPSCTPPPCPTASQVVPHLPDGCPMCAICPQCTADSQCAAGHFCSNYQCVAGRFCGETPTPAPSYEPPGTWWNLTLISFSLCPPDFLCVNNVCEPCPPCPKIPYCPGGLVPGVKKADGCPGCDYCDTTNGCNDVECGPCCPAVGPHTLPCRNCGGGAFPP